MSTDCHSREGRACLVFGDCFQVRSLQEFYALAGFYEAGPYMCMIYEYPSFISTYVKQTIRSDDIKEIINLMSRCFDDAMCNIVTHDDEFNYAERVHEALTDWDCNIKATRSLMQFLLVNTIVFKIRHTVQSGPIEQQ